MSFKHVTDEILSGYLSGELTAREKYDAESHFTICPECAAKLEKQRDFEKKIAAVYSSSFPLYLSPDAHCAITEEVSAGIAVNAKAPLWQKRIIIKFFTQVASVMFVAASVAVMILTQRKVVPAENMLPFAETPKAAAPVEVDTLKRNQNNKIIRAPHVNTVLNERKQAPVIKKQVAAAPVKSKNEAAVSLPVKRNDVPVKPVAAKPAVVAENTVVATKKTSVDRSFLQPNKALEKLFRIDQIAIRKTSDHIFLLYVVKAPFADGLYVVYAASGVPDKDSDRRVELTLSTLHKISSVIRHPAGQKDVCVMFFRADKLPDEIAKLDFAISGKQEKQVNTLLIGKDRVAQDFNTAPEQVKLAAVMYAASVPRLILKRDIRAKVMAELEKLLNGGYAADPQVKGMYQQLKKVR